MKQQIIKELSYEPVSRPGTLKTIPSLQQCQITTPPRLVEFLWNLVLEHRSKVDSVIDLGAGDARFAIPHRFATYVGYEIDRTKYDASILPVSAKMVNKDVLFSTGKYDLAIGNPPYIRHQDINDEWKKVASKIIKDETHLDISGLSNLYQYFMWVSLLRTKDDGLVCQIVPSEWIYRPSAMMLRNYIKKNGWKVEVYRLPEQVFFHDIATVPSITIIDKARTANEFTLLNLDESLNKVNHSNLTGPNTVQFKFVSRNPLIYAQRGLSTGSQDYFILTEKQRRELKIKMTEVVPCVTTLKPIGLSDYELDKSTFYSNYVDGDRKCWLIRTDKTKLSENLMKYLQFVPDGIRRNSTCGNREPWYLYRTPSPPQILYSSSFRNGNRPKIVVNKIGARNISAVHGIYLQKDAFPLVGTASLLLEYDFSIGTIPTINGLRKIEVKQMNGILSNIFNKAENRGDETGRCLESSS